MQPQVTYHPSLKERTTLRLGGTAIAEVLLKGESDFERLPELLTELGGTPLALGRGSNLLAKDDELPLVLLRQESVEPPRILQDEEDYAIIEVPAAHPLPLLLYFAAEQGLAGLEGLAGIPGSVGGAIAMNAGSFGAEIGSFLSEVHIFTPEQGLFRKPADEINPTYRNFTFSGQGLAAWHVIFGATLRLNRGDKKTIHAQMQENILKKTASQPMSAASAGCTFKNPSREEPAGLLLDKCGFKGKRLGGMMFSELHANFLVNRNNGSSEEAMQLIGEARAAVKNEFGHELELEVRVIP